MYGLLLWLILYFLLCTVNTFLEEYWSLQELYCRGHTRMGEGGGLPGETHNPHPHLTYQHMTNACKTSSLHGLYQNVHFGGFEYLRMKRLL